MSQRTSNRTAPNEGILNQATKHHMIRLTHETMSMYLSLMCLKADKYNFVQALGFCEKGSSRYFYLTDKINNLTKRIIRLEKRLNKLAIKQT